MDKWEITQIYEVNGKYVIAKDIQDAIEVYKLYSPKSDIKAVTKVSTKDVTGTAIKRSSINKDNLIAYLENLKYINSSDIAIKLIDDIINGIKSSFYKQYIV